MTFRVLYSADTCARRACIRWIVLAVANRLADAERVARGYRADFPGSSIRVAPVKS
jgi:hypothetical protein